VQPVNPHEWREQQTNDETVLPTGTARTFDPWNFKGDSGLPSAQDILGYHVEATDGRIGKIDEVFSAIDGSYVVVDTGPWIFGRQVMLPAGTVNHVDHSDRKVYVDRTKDEIKNSPEVDVDQFQDPAYRDKLAGYYGGPGYQGSTGFQSGPGYEGSTGFQSSPGYEGSTGNQSSPGYQGDTGYQGGTGSATRQPY